jgi:hypothetical protein
VSDLALSLLLLAGGLFFFVHCSLATRREWRGRQAFGGRWGEYDQVESPLGYWLIMAGNFGAALMGFVFLLVGGAILLGHLGIIK